MSKRKKKEMEQEIMLLEPLRPLTKNEEEMMKRADNMAIPGSEFRELKAGNLAEFFSQLNPDTSVYNTGEGQFEIDASDEEIQRLANPCECNYGSCAECKCDTTPDINGIPRSEMYGYAGPEIQNIARSFDSGNYSRDIEDMDVAIAMYIADVQSELCSKIKDTVDNMIADATMDAVKNLIEYQNARNVRTEMELAVRKVK